MNVRVLFFGQARERAGASERTLPLPEGVDVGEVAQLLGEAWPSLAPLLERCSFAINETYATREERLSPGDELAVIPPIGGG